MSGEILPRVIRLLELVEDGRRRDGSLPGDVVAELEITLEGLEDDLTFPSPRLRCVHCSRRFHWPGELSAHLYQAHWRLESKRWAA